MHTCAGLLTCMEWLAGRWQSFAAIIEEAGVPGGDGIPGMWYIVKQCIELAASGLSCD